MFLGTNSRLHHALVRQLPHLGLTQHLRLGFGLLALTITICGAMSASGFQRVARHADAASALLAKKIEDGEAKERPYGWAEGEYRSILAPDEPPANARAGDRASPEEVLARLRAVSANARRSESLATGFALAAGLFALAASIGLIQRIRTPLRAGQGARRTPAGAGPEPDPAPPAVDAGVEEVDLGAALKAAHAFQSEALEAQTRLASAEVKGAELAQTNDDLEGFVRSVSHDLKAPLASMTGFLRIARETLEDGDPEGAIPLLDRAEQASLRADRLVRELLELARIGRSGEPEAVHVRDFVANVLEEHDAAIEASDMKIEAEPELGVVFADPRALRQILSNVIGNALIHGSSAAEPRLCIACARSDDGLQLRIADNGAGIPRDSRGRAFVPFERLTDRGEGSGLGLSLVERAMARAGGIVTVEDTPGGGATFVLHFPAPPERDVAESPVLVEALAFPGGAPSCEYGG